MLRLAIRRTSLLGPCTGFTIYVSTDAQTHLVPMVAWVGRISSSPPCTICQLTMPKRYRGRHSAMMHLALLRRPCRNKGKWRREVMLIGLSTATPPLDGSTTRPDASTIQQALSSPTHPNMFRIVARVVDYFPFCLEDACVLRCTKCKFE
jgi:hypothetical protein